MRIFTLLFFVSFMSFSQSKEHVGNYELSKENGTDYFIKNNLTLNPNGTFLFKSHTFIKKRLPSEKIEYGKGSWTSEGRLIQLSTNDSDVDATHTLNLNSTKLRFDTKSPRDKSNRDIKTSVRIISTKVYWLNGRTLFKIE